MQLTRALCFSALTLSFGAGCDAPLTPTTAAQPLAVTEPAHGRHHGHELDVRHVLLLSIDGMHEVDLDALHRAPTRSSTLAALARHGVQYTNAWVNRLDGSATNPSDSFPGLLALTTGGSSRDARRLVRRLLCARSLRPALRAARARAAPPSPTTRASSRQLSHLWGNASDDTPTHDVDGGARRASIRRSCRMAKHRGACTPVYPHQYIRVNTIFEVAKAAGLHTAWSDKHLAYELVNGPSGERRRRLLRARDQLGSVEEPDPVGAGGRRLHRQVDVDRDLRRLQGAGDPQPDRRAAGATPGCPAPADTAGPRAGHAGDLRHELPGAQRRAEGLVGERRLLDAAGTPGPEVADALAHTDASIGKMVAALEARDLLRSTLDHRDRQARAVADRQDGSSSASMATRWRRSIDGAAPVAGHIEDDVALYWLHDARRPRRPPRAALSSHRRRAPDPRVDTRLHRGRRRASSRCSAIRRAIRARPTSSCSRRRARSIR